MLPPNDQAQRVFKFSHRSGQRSSEPQKNVTGCTNITDRQTTNGWAIAYSERERAFTFAKNGKMGNGKIGQWKNATHEKGNIYVTAEKTPIRNLGNRKLAQQAMLTGFNGE